MSIDIFRKNFSSFTPRATTKTKSSNAKTAEGFFSTPRELDSSISEPSVTLGSLLPTEYGDIIRPALH